MGDPNELDPLLEGATATQRPDGESEDPSGSGDQPPFLELLQLDANSATNEQLTGIVQRQVQYTFERFAISATYNVLLLYNTQTLERPDADRIYTALAGADRTKPLLLVMYSPGGDLATAYLISKLCREFTPGQFHVAVPRQAKSAATLIACGADGIHMGSLSELGPIDPQFGAIPALALKYSVEHIAILTAAYPDAAGMFAEYLARTLRVEALGYYERVAESAIQYATRLLGSRQVWSERDNYAVAHRLVYDYKDHGFVIDLREAADIFGPGLVYANTSEYEIANALYSILSVMEWFLGRTFNRNFSYVGSDAGCTIYERSVG